jgi:hypothetical protein
MGNDCSFNCYSKNDERKTEQILIEPVDRSIKSSDFCDKDIKRQVRLDRETEFNNNVEDHSGEDDRHMNVINAVTGAMKGFLIAYSIGLEHQYKNLEEMKN